MHQSQNTLRILNLILNWIKVWGDFSRQFQNTMEDAVYMDLHIRWSAAMQNHPVKTPQPQCQTLRHCHLHEYQLKQNPVFMGYIQFGPEILWHNHHDFGSTCNHIGFEMKQLQLNWSVDFLGWIQRVEQKYMIKHMGIVAIFIQTLLISGAQT